MPSAVAVQGMGPGSTYFWTKLRPEGRKIFFFKTGPFFSQGLDDPHPPPRLSEGLDPPLQCRSKKVSQTHQDLEKDLCSFFLALSRWRERVGNLSNDHGNVNEKGKKSNWFRLAKQQPYT